MAKTHWCMGCSLAMCSLVYSPIWVKESDCVCLVFSWSAASPHHGFAVNYTFLEKNFMQYLVLAQSCIWCSFWISGVSGWKETGILMVNLQLSKLKFGEVGLGCRIWSVADTFVNSMVLECVNGDCGLKTMLEKLLLSSYSQVSIVMAYCSTCWKTLGFLHLVETWALNPLFLGLIFYLFLFIESDGLQVGMCDFFLPWQPDMKLPKHISLSLQTTHHQKPPLPSAEAMRISWATAHPLGWKMPLFLKDWNSSLSSSLPTSLGKTHVPGPKIVSRNISTLQSNRALMRMPNYTMKNIWCHEDSWILAGNMTWMWIMNPTSIT